MQWAVPKILITWTLTKKKKKREKNWYNEPWKAVIVLTLESPRQIARRVLVQLLVLRSLSMPLDGLVQAYSIFLSTLLREWTTLLGMPLTQTVLQLPAGGRNNALLGAAKEGVQCRVFPLESTDSSPVTASTRGLFLAASGQSDLAACSPVASNFLIQSELHGWPSPPTTSAMLNLSDGATTKLKAMKLL